VLWLGLDASGPGAALAAVRDGEILGEIAWHEPRSAGTHLLAWVDELVGAFGQPDALAVGVGPGSFTGVRLAVTAAKTLAWAWSVPLYACSSLAARAAGAPVGTVVVSSVERRGDRVYLGVYLRTRAGVEPLLADRPWLLPAVPDDFDPGAPVLVAGPLARDAAFLAQIARHAEPLDERGLGSGVITAATMVGRPPVEAMGLVPAYLQEPLVTVKGG
jgi:tRNA threonylcarbamoyladenosine biosynthesis protein TsaB